MKKEHRFMLSVQSHGNRRSAELAVLSAFAGRNPDGCEFTLSKEDGEKEPFSAGVKTGARLAFGLSLLAIESEMVRLKIEREPRKRK